METSGEELPPSRRLIVMVEHPGKEIPQSFPESQAEAAWAAISAAWHPALLARVDSLPIIEGVEFPPYPDPGDVRIVAQGAGQRLPQDYRQLATDANAMVVEGGIDRHALVRSLLDKLEPGSEPGDPGDPLVGDFYALGTARWWLKDLTLAMGHADCLDLESLTRETLQGAKDWLAGERTGASNRLRAAFEVLTQARERFYPVDAYLLDLVLLDPALPAGSLADSLAARTPFSVIAPASAIDRTAAVDPDAVAALRTAVTDGWADVVGGTYGEIAEPLAPLTSILWQYRKGGEVYRTHLDDRNVETLATRRFALYPQRAQLARRFGFRFALHLGLDSGRFPIPIETKRLWESPDGSHLETLMRPPISADRPSEASRLAWRLGKSMKDDHVATVAIAHWPNPVAGWFVDFRRMNSYSPVLARLVTVGDYFHLSDRPWEMFRPKPDDYTTPYLDQAVARSSPEPISGAVRHARLRSRLDALTVIDALAESLTHPASEVGDDVPARGPITASEARFAAIEEPLETGHLVQAESMLDHEEERARVRLAGAIAGSSAGGRPGFLVLNPLGIARKAPVVLPGASDNLMAEGPLIAAQPTEDGVVGVVELAGFGFSWVPRDSAPESTLPASAFVGVDGQTLRNETTEVEIDPATGGIRSLRLRGETTARMGQQIAVVGLLDEKGQAASSRMVGEDFTIDYAGPALVRASSVGKLVHPEDGRILVRFRQEFRLWSGRPNVEIDVHLDFLDDDLRTQLAHASPWSTYVACRWAWPDATSRLRRAGLLSPSATETERPETPDAIEISTRSQRTTLLFGGLTHHRRHGTRMLDTLLLAGAETERSFKLGVVLDHDHPFRASQDFLTPVCVVPTEAGPPRSGPSGWLIQVESKAIAVVQVEFVKATADGRGWGLSLILVETSGYAARCKVRFFRDPIAARQTDFHGELIIDLPCVGDSVPLDLTPHEMARIEVTLGS